MIEKCACHSDDAHRCFSLRYYGHSAASELTVWADGGPCECSCHEECDDNDDNEGYPIFGESKP